MKNKLFFSYTKDCSFLQSERHVNVECPLHLHSTMELVLVTEGTLHMTVAKDEYDISAKQGVFVPPFETHSFHSALPNRCHVLEFSRELVPYFFDYVKEYVPTTHLFSISAESLCLSQALLKQEPIGIIPAVAVLSPLCYDVFCDCGFEKRQQPLDDTVAEILEYVNEHFRDDISLERVAREIGVHPVTLSKIFTKQAGVSFTHYLQYVRCTHVEKLIRTTQKSFSEIAYDSGFGSIRSFNRTFRTFYGQSPTAYKAIREESERNDIKAAEAEPEVLFNDTE